MDTETNPKFMLVAVVHFLCLFLKSEFSLGANVISANQPLTGYSTVVSAGGVFVLGFFRPGESSKYYIGIWYQIDPSRTIVWVANREKPVSFYSELRMSDGNLVLYNDSNVPVWSTNVNSTTSASVQAILLDTGNLVLNDGSITSKPFWQSFDYPTNTLLPGNKIGYNKITKTNQILTSWKSLEDPAPGLFSLQLEPKDNSYNLVWNMSKKYWTSGSWNGHIFSLIPEMRPDYIFDYKFVSNENETYFTYSMKNISLATSRMVVGVSGQARQLTWLPRTGWYTFWSQPRQQCEVYAFCGAYGSCTENSFPFCHCLTRFKPKLQTNWDLADYSDGCFRTTNLQCGNNSLANGETDKFIGMSNMSFPGNKLSVQAGKLTECESICMTNCSCTAYAYDSDGCSIWTGDLLDLRANNSKGTLYVRLAASESPNPKKAKKVSVKIVGIIAAAILIFCIACFAYYRRRKEVANRQGDRENIQGNPAVRLYDTEKHMKDFIQSNQFREDEKKGIDVPFVVLESILAATDNFSEANKLGKGGFGPVYKGKFQGGQEIAIKRLSSGSGQGLQEFKNEVLLIAKLQHRNLVRLLGYCVEGDEKMLLYEYMPNKSLDSFIFDRTQCVLLSWEMRLNIIMGIARGLLYLHHDSRFRIIHRDLKTSNVLLDEDMNPKISDFGLARIFGGKQTEANTTRVVGTYGYMSPEYALDGFFSIKSDVFSFGVMVLEIISGKRNTGFYQSEQALSLLGYAWKLWKENKPSSLMDAALSETCNANEFLRCVNVGLLCVQDDPSDRPTMSTVVFMLGSETATLPSPKQPAFVVRRSLPSSGSPSKPLSVNELTATSEQGR